MSNVYYDPVYGAKVQNDSCFNRWTWEETRKYMKHPQDRHQRRMLNEKNKKRGAKVPAGDGTQCPVEEVSYEVSQFGTSSEDTDFKGLTLPS